MYDFTYRRVESLADARRAFEAAEEAQYLAGGHTLLPTMKQRLASPTDLIDIAGIPRLDVIALEGDMVVVGALATHAAVAAHALVSGAIPALAALADGIGDPQVRNRGTIGGSIANNDPAADYPAALVGLRATVRTDRREIKADDFFTGMFETALEPGELVTAVAFPIPLDACYAKFPNPASRYAVVGAMVARYPSGVRVAVTGAASCVFHARDMERALDDDFSPAALDGIAVADSDLNDDIHASAEYRAHLVGVMVRRAVAGCV